MSFRAVRITINRSEFALLEPGFNRLANGLSTAEHGNFPDYHAGRLGMVNTKIYRDRAHDQEMHDQVISARRKLLTMPACRKVRLNEFEIRAAAFALRLDNPRTNRRRDRDEVRALARKLEMFRKRAKRRTRTFLNPAEISQKAEAWRRFVDWCRFNIAHVRLPQMEHTYRRSELWADLRTRLRAMIAQAIEESRFAPLPAPQMSRVSRLIKEEVRRGRHPFTLRAFLAANTPANRSKLFEIVAKKVELIPLPGAKLNICIVQSEISEKIHAVRARRIAEASSRALASQIHPSPSVAAPRLSHLHLRRCRHQRPDRIGHHSQGDSAGSPASIYASGSA